MLPDTEERRYSVLHPFSYMPPAKAYGQEPPFFTIEKGEGSWVYDGDGKRYLYTTTAVPSVGLGHPKVIKTIAEQCEKLSFASSCEQSHPLLQQLANQLIEIAGSPYSMVSFSNDGSGAVETAMRLVRQYFITKGESRRSKFISLEGNYHGTTFGSGSVTHLGIQSFFGKGLEDCYSVPAPNLYRPSIEGSPEFVIQFCLNMLEETIHEQHPHSIAAVLLEPVQGVNGIVVMPHEFIRAVREMTRKYGIMLIMDEVATGLGRTGHWLAAHDYGVEADLTTLSKGLTGGYFPMGATLISEEIRKLLFDQGGIFLHGSTQSGHPVGCAAALATLELIRENRLIENAASLGSYIREQLQNELHAHTNVGEVRGKGLMLAIEFVADQGTKESVAMDWGKRLTRRLYEEGILGNFFNGILLMYPPLNISREEADYLIQGVVKAIRGMNDQ